MPDPANRNHIQTLTARTAIKEFCGEALRRAGGASELAAALADLGFRGRDDEYTASTFEQWISGYRAPRSEILIALALRYRIPLDGIISAAEDVEEQRAALKEAGDRLRRLARLEPDEGAA